MLLLSLSKMLITIVLFMILANIKQSIYYKIVYLMVVGIYKIHTKIGKIEGYEGKKHLMFDDYILDKY